MLCKTKIDNCANGEQILTICNSNTGMETVIPTHERGKLLFSWPHRYTSSDLHIHELHSLYDPHANFP